MPDRDLPDLNVWLALADADHQHHARARQYWEKEASSQLSFCRVSMLGLLRLLSNSKVMRGNPFTPTEGLQAYRSFLTLPEVSFLVESPHAESRFVQWSDAPAFSPHRWTDAWLAALAVTSQSRLVSFDSDFHFFPGFSFLHLTPSAEP